MSVIGIKEGEDVLMRGKDGFIYLGVAVEIDATDAKDPIVLVRFGDGTETWSRISDVRLLGSNRFELEEDSPLTIRPAQPPVTSVKSKKRQMAKPLPKYDLKNDRNSRNDCSQKPSKPYLVPGIIPEHVLSARKELPYDFDSLLWDENHQRNDKERYCYCGESGDWYKKMLQCDQCRQWFHQECIRSNQLPPLLLGDRFYEFVCTLCTGTCQEHVYRKDLSWVDAIHLALFNLTVSNNNKYHDLNTSILPFLKKRWKELQGPGGRLKHSRLEPQFISSQLSSHKSRFRCGSEYKNRSNYWGLRKIAPPSPSTTPTNGVVTNGTSIKIKLGPKKPMSVNSDSRRRPVMKNSSLDSTEKDSNGKIDKLKLFDPFAAKKKIKKIQLAKIGDKNGKAFNFNCGRKVSLDILIPPSKDYLGANNPFWDFVAMDPPVLEPEVTLLPNPKNGEKKSCRCHQRRLQLNKRKGRLRPRTCECGRSSKMEEDSLIKQPSGALDEHPPKLDFFQTPDLTSTNGGFKAPISTVFNGSVSSKVDCARLQLLARRLTINGDIQYLTDWISSCNGCPSCDIKGETKEDTNGPPQLTKFS